MVESPRTTTALTPVRLVPATGPRHIDPVDHHRRAIGGARGGLQHRAEIVLAHGHPQSRRLVIGNGHQIGAGVDQELGLPPVDEAIEMELARTIAGNHLGLARGVGGLWGRRIAPRIAVGLIQHRRRGHRCDLRARHQH